MKNESPPTESALYMVLVPTVQVSLEMLVAPGHWKIVKPCNQIRHEFSNWAGRASVPIIQTLINSCLNGGHLPLYGPVPVDQLSCLPRGPQLVPLGKYTLLRVIEDSLLTSKRRAVGCHNVLASKSRHMSSDHEPVQKIIDGINPHDLLCWY